MGAVVAVCGKGGVGKTTLSSLLVRALADDDRRVLVVDADPAGGLCLALGREPARTLNDLRREVIEAAEQGGLDKIDLAAVADYRLLELLDEDGGAAFLAVGRPEEEGCFCRLNVLLRTAIEALSQSFDLVLIDAEAGIEQVNRRVMRSVTHLLLVTDPTRKGLRVIQDIHCLAGRAVDYERAGVLINRVRDQDLARSLASESPAAVLALVPEDAVVGQFDAAGRSFSQLEDCPALVAVRGLLAERSFFPAPG